MFGWFCFGTINLLGFFFYQGWEWAWELGSPCTFWFIVVIMWNRPISMCGSLIGNKGRSKLKQGPTNYRKVKKELRWIHIRLSTTLLIDLCVQWRGHGSYHWHKTLHSSTTTTLMSTFDLVLITILGYIIATKRK